MVRPRSGEYSGEYFQNSITAVKGINLQQNSYNVLHQIVVYTEGIDVSLRISYIYGILT